VLVDVGLARRLGDKSDPAGTPGYIAPESFRGEPESPATDVYGLAATTYALLTGQAPFGRADDYREILRRQVDDAPTPPSRWREDLPAGLDGVVLRALAVEPHERYASAGDLARALEIVLSEGLDTEPGTRPAPISRRTDPQFAVPAASRGGDSKRTLTIELGPVRNEAPEPLTRGVVFRAVTRVLGLRAATAWGRSVERQNQALGDALSLRTSPIAWLPAELFRDLFAAVTASGRNAVTFARELGSTVVEQSFARFYPSSAEALSPVTTLSALDILWRRYHSWGDLRLTRSIPGSAEVAWDGPPDAVMCAFIEGWLERVVQLSGGTDPRATHSASTFTLTWGQAPT
jgi:serine/threonine protein kinase